MSAEKKVVMAFGRMNPPTAGHAKLVDKVKAVASSEGADHSIRLSHSQDSKKNPLTASQKVHHAKRLFPGTNISTSSKTSPSYLTHAAELHKQGYKHLVMVAGEDRAQQYHDTLHKYNGKFDEHGNGFHFKSIKVVSAGHRDPDAEGTEGISASKMRDHAKTGNFKEFHKGLPHGTSHVHANALFHDVRSGMKLQEEKERDAYVRGEVFNKGDLVEDLTTGQICPVEYRGDNYVTILTTEGNIEKRFIKDITMADEDLNEDYYLNRWAKQKAADNRIANWEPPKPRLATKVASKVFPAVDHAKMARHIEAAWGNSFPDGDPYDHLAHQYPHLHREGELFKHLNLAAKKHLGVKSYNHYLAQGWDDYHNDQGHDPNSLTHGQTNPWKEAVEAEEKEELVEGLPRAAVKLLNKSDSISKDPDVSHPFKVAASHILQGDFHGLANHLRVGPGSAIKAHVMQALQQYGGEEGKSMVNHLRMEEVELVEWEVGDIVKPTVGPHVHAPHTVIHKHADGSVNIRPNLPAKMVKYKLGAVKARPEQLSKYHTEEANVESVEPTLVPLGTLEEKKLTDEQKATRERIVKGMKKHLGDFHKRYGKKAKSVMMATATKQAMGEEVDDQAESFMVYAASAKALANKQKAKKAAKTKAKNAAAKKPVKEDSEVETKYTEPKTLYQTYQITLDEVEKDVLIPIAVAEEFESLVADLSSTEEVQTLVSRLSGIIQ